MEWSLTELRARSGNHHGRDFVGNAFPTLDVISEVQVRHLQHCFHLVMLLHG